MGVFVASYIALWIIALVQAIALFALYHHFGAMYLSSREGREAQGPRAGTQLKVVNARDIDGAPVMVPPAATAALLVFVSTTCPVCDRLRGELQQFATRYDDIELAVICAGEVEAVRRWAKDLRGPMRVVPDPGYRMALRYDIGITPFGIGVTRDGVVHGRGLASNRAALEALAEAALTAPEPQLSESQLIEVLPEVPGHVRSRA